MSQVWVYVVDFRADLWFRFGSGLGWFMVGSGLVKVGFRFGSGLVQIWVMCGSGVVQVWRRFGLV